MRTIVIKANGDRGLREIPLLVVVIMSFATGEFSISVKNGLPGEPDSTQISMDSDLYYNQLEQLDYIQNRLALGIISIEEHEIPQATYYALGL
jgi:hypothetical protein